jgi:hypothetical protein
MIVTHEEARRGGIADHGREMLCSLLHKQLVRMLVPATLLLSLPDRSAL